MYLCVGVFGSLRTCLHSILMLVEHGSGQTAGSSCHYSYPQLAELCYKVLYQLSSHQDLSIPTLRYLRNNHDFLHTQLTHLPLNPSNLLTDKDGQDIGDGDKLPTLTQISLLHQQAWLLRSAAIELRMTVLNHQRSHTQRLLNLLLSEPNNGNNGEQLVVGLAGNQDQVKSDFEFLQEGRRKILVLLDMVDFKEYPTPPFNLEYFDLTAVEGAIKLCESKVCQLVYHKLMSFFFAPPPPPLLFTYLFVCRRL